jgi:hypothetical protein
MTAPAPGADAAHDLSGTYVLTAPTITMTLVLRQDTEGALHGTLSSTSGAQFQVDGKVQDGVGHGACVGTQGVSSYFHANAAEPGESGIVAGRTSAIKFRSG